MKMQISPETNPLIWGAGPLASASLGDTSDWVCLKGCEGMFIFVTEIGNNATDLVLDHVHQGIVNGTSGAVPVLTTGQEFPIWLNLLTTTTDHWVRQTNALTYTIGHTAIAKMVAFYIPSDLLTPGYSWIQLGTSGGHATNIVTVHYQPVGVRFKGDLLQTFIA